MEPGIPFTDNHAHLNPSIGLGPKAVEQFVRHGGRNLVLVNLLTKYYGGPACELDAFRTMYDKHLELVDRVRSLYKIRVYAVIGPHPAELTELLRRGVSLQAARRLMMRAIDEAIKRIAEGRAIALGEIGRPHYPVPREVWRASNEIFMYALERAAQAGVPVQIHMETPTEASLEEVAEMCDRAGLPRGKAVIHHAPPDAVRHCARLGLIPSVTARRAYILRALEAGGPFLLETDYLDDPRRPGAVLSLRTIPRQLRILLQEGILDRERCWEISVSLPERVYGVPFH